MKYAYYPGCSLHSSAVEFGMSTEAVCKALGIELEEIPDWVCCGASSGHMTSELLSLALPVQNMVQAKQVGGTVAVPCAACYSRLMVTNKTMARGGKLAEQVDEVVGTSYRGDTKVEHILQVIASDEVMATLAEKATGSLNGLKAAAYYGCLLVRPPETVAFDDPENPTVLDNLIRSIGAEPVDWPYKTECCGGSLSLTRTDVVEKLCNDILTMAADEGAECLVVACPLCQSNLDLRQAQINRRYKTNYQLPVIYFTQLVGLALGLSAKELGLDKLSVDPMKLLKAKALV